VSAPQYTSRILKAGAAIDDTRRVVEVWDISASAAENIERISAENTLGKPSRSRLDDLLNRVISPRYVEPGPHIIPALRGLLSDHRAFTDACYYETARCDALLAAFAEGPVRSWWQDGKTVITVAEAAGWLEKLAAEGRAPVWTSSVRERAAQGVLSALRDFGILRGATRSPRKEIASPSISARGFCYAAWREHELGASSHALVHASAWDRWLLDTPTVLAMLDLAARMGVLRFSSAGSAVRVDWLARSLAEVTGADA
jgi:hypothetical protein